MFSGQVASQHIQNRVDVNNTSRGSGNGSALRCVNQPLAEEMFAKRSRRILVLCLGGIGDSILSFAALRDLRRACPADHITALAMWPQSADLLQDLGVFDRVFHHNFQHEGMWRSILITLKCRVQRYDVSILTFPANRFEYNLVSFLIGAKRRLGHSYLNGSNIGNLRFLLSQKEVQQDNRHNIDENRALFAKLTGCRVNGPSDISIGSLHPKHHRNAERLLGHLKRPLVGIHPGGSVFKGLSLKRWSAENFGELCRRLHLQFGVTPVIFGNPDEVELKFAIQARCPQVFFAYGPTIRDTAAQIACCRAFVSNDSSLAHLASAVDTPVIMLCGPTNPSQVKPYTATGTVLHSKVPCSPCFDVGRRPMQCKNSRVQYCMKSITVDAVFAAVVRYLPELNADDSPIGKEESLEPSISPSRGKAATLHSQRGCRMAV